MNVIFVFQCEDFMTRKIVNTVYQSLQQTSFSMSLRHSSVYKRCLDVAGSIEDVKSLPKRRKCAEMEYQYHSTKSASKRITPFQFEFKNLGTRNG